MNADVLPPHERSAAPAIAISRAARQRQPHSPGQPGHGRRRGDCGHFVDIRELDVASVE